MTCVWRLEDNFWEPVLSFHFHMGSGGWIQISRFAVKSFTSWASHWLVDLLRNSEVGETTTNRMGSKEKITFKNLIYLFIIFLCMHMCEVCLCVIYVHVCVWVHMCVCKPEKEHPPLSHSILFLWGRPSPWTCSYVLLLGQRPASPTHVSASLSAGTCVWP